MGSNGFPRSHADLNDGHPGLGENRFEGVLVVKVLPTSFSPKAKNDEAAKNVQGLSWISETSCVIGEGPWGVILLLHRHFAQQGEGPSDLQLVRRLPFHPDSFESFPGAARHGAIEEEVLNRFF